MQIYVLLPGLMRYENDILRAYYVNLLCDWKVHIMHDGNKPLIISSRHYKIQQALSKRNVFSIRALGAGHFPGCIHGHDIGSDEPDFLIGYFQGAVLKPCRKGLFMKLFYFSSAVSAHAEHVRKVSILGE